MACIRSGCLLSIVPPFLSPAVELPASVIAGWPPRSRTERYRFIRAGPFDRLGRGQQMAEDPTPAVARLPDFESGTASMAVSSSTDLPRCERAGGCGGWRSRLPAPCGAHPLSTRSRPPGRFILQARKAGDLNARVSPPHPLATEPGAPVRFTFHSYSFVPNRGFEPRTSWFWARRLYLSWASSACEPLAGFEPATSTVARWRSCLLSYNRMEASPVPTRAIRRRHSFDSPS